LNHMTIAEEIVGGDLTPKERLPVLCEIVRKTESLQVRAISVLLADEEYVQTHGNWTSFCRAEFGWDDSYASRMKKAASMVLDGSTITTEAQARVLSKIDPDKREEILEKAREKTAGSEPSASVIASVIAESDEEDAPHNSRMLTDQKEIDAVIAAMRDVLRKIKDLPKNGSGRWINMPHLVADLKNAANALKHGRPHGECDEWGKHDENCLCGGTGWLPKHVLERPKEANNGK
jgi:hypothetical protein